jgi:hypothetical protein
MDGRRGGGREGGREEGGGGGRERERGRERKQGFCSSLNMLTSLQVSSCMKRQAGSLGQFLHEEAGW